ncbi:hypothetical protein ZOSMA_150G00070 [Zostera marina]|uniref:DUF674 family protein n=1 Tax=Zostera marina TaxID=29655 RepID=A0A0K9PW01_ZOSMR|nr:hypothetical protein ZOSMA_150G00070 [Zostera marina]
MAATKISLKLLINKSTNKVLFAEANKDFVDFLFSLLALPLGAVVKILTHKHVVGSLGHLYRSLKNLSISHLQSKTNRDNLLNPYLPTALCQLLNQPEELRSLDYDYEHVKKGYVKEGFAYMVMDDLSVSPISTISSITVLSKFQVKDVGVLVEKTVRVGMDECIKILRFSMQSTTILSDVFLGAKIKRESDT